MLAFVLSKHWHIGHIELNYRRLLYLINKNSGACSHWLGGVVLCYRFIEGFAFSAGRRHYGKDERNLQSKLPWCVRVSSRRRLICLRSRFNSLHSAIFARLQIAETSTGTSVETRQVRWMLATMAAVFFNACPYKRTATSSSTVRRNRVP